jgi:serine/threonine protein kinase
MVQLTARSRLGSLVLTKPLSPGVLGDRWLAFNEADQTNRVVVWIRNWRPDAWQGGADDDARLASVLADCRALRHPHILSIDEIGHDDDARAYVVTPYTGDQNGIVTLDLLLRTKGGFLAVEESKRALEQLLAAVVHAHESGMAHGDLSMAEIQVDTRGRVCIDLYGVARALSSAPRSIEEDRAAEIRSICRLGYQMLTGLRPDTPLIPAGRVVLGLHRTWEDFFETGLGTPGFSSADHALSALTACRTSLHTSGLGRMGSAIRGLLRSRS